MSDINDEEQSWFVKGTIRFVTADGAEKTESILARNVIARDRRMAANSVLNDYKDFLEFKGKVIAEIDWSNGPDISPFDPYHDL